MKVQAAPVKTVCRDFTLGRIRAGWSVNQRAVLALSVPNGCDAERHRPIRRLLVDRSVAIVPQLIAVILECLPERAKHRPGKMACRARHSILARECWERPDLNGGQRKRIGGAAIPENDGDNQ